MGVLRSWDNVDGLFVNYVGAGIDRYLERQSRFRKTQLAEADQVLAKSKASYSALIQDNEILGRIARNTRSQSLLRTRVFKEGSHYRFVMEWLLPPRMEVLSEEQFTVSDPGKGQTLRPEELEGKIADAADRMVQKVPFLGHVTGRDDSAVTVNIGRNAELRPGSRVTISTLEEVKLHPLLKKAVEWRFVPVGKIEIDVVEEKIAFGKVIEQEPGQRIDRYQKVTRIEPPQIRPETAAGGRVLEGQRISEEGHETNDPDAPYVRMEDGSIVQAKEEDPDRPTLGWVGIGVGVGNFSRDFSQTSTGTTSGKTGGGLLFGGKGELQIWLKREIFFDLSLQYASFGYSQKDLASGTASTATFRGSMTDIRFASGYMFHLSEHLFGPKAWARLGYHSLSNTLTASTAEFTGPTSFSGMFLGVGGDLPFRGGWGAQLAMDFTVIRSARETQQVSSSALPLSSSDLWFFLGGYKQIDPKLRVRVGLDIFINSLEFSTENVQQRAISFGPALVYYF